jgi:hypothetical protein
MLVIRAWLTTYDERRRRLNRLIGLAPASFGSPLADMGRSFLGSIFKGNKHWGPDFLEAGDAVLDGLELGSQFTWDLAHRDLLPTADHADGFYGPDSDTPYVFIFCGTEPYPGLRGIVNKPGTDGTVRWAGCSLRTRKITLDLTRDPARAKTERRFVVLRGANVDIPLIPAHGLNHATILSHPTESLQAMVLEALAVSSMQNFTDWHAKWRATKEQGYAYLTDQSGEWTQFVTHAVDERGDPITDYHVQIYRLFGISRGKYSGTPYSKMSSGTPRAHGAASMTGPDAPATLETGLAPVKPVKVAHTSLAASGSSDADISLRLEQVTKSKRF